MPVDLTGDAVAELVTSVDLPGGAQHWTLFEGGPGGGATNGDPLISVIHDDARGFVVDDGTVYVAALGGSGVVLVPVGEGAPVALGD